MSKLSTNLKGHVSTSQVPDKDTSWSEGSPGPFIGIVKGNKDPARMGRLNVFIPALAKTDEDKQDNLIICEYLSPFYGAKDIAHNSSGSSQHQYSQHSYGFWGVPPDIGTRVLVIFAEGKASQAYWIGCIQEPLINHMTPGLAASDKTWDKGGGGPPGTPSSNIDKEKTYGTKKVVAGEINRLSNDNIDPVANYDSIPLPIHPFSNVLLEQGLIEDEIRGTTTSSARRETPSQVFGISTPGRLNEKTQKKQVGPKDELSSEFVTRDAGHTFVMDDGDANRQNQLTRLRTSSGHQLLMHDTEGVVYLANGSGKSWLEMSSDGKVYIYAQDGFNLRADGNFDLHAGGDINFHSKNSIKFTAEGEIVNNANAILNLGSAGIFNTSQEGVISSFSKSGITSFTGGQQLHGGAGTHLAGGQIHFNSIQPSSDWGPTWLNPQSAGIVIDESQNDVNIAVGPGQKLEANTKKTITSVPNLVTHEPFERAPSAVNENVSQWDDPVKWKQLSETPGTLEYMAQKNRESDVEYIRELQFIQDAKKYVEAKSGLDKTISGIVSPYTGGAGGLHSVAKNLDITKAKKLSDAFAKDYQKVFNVKNKIESLSTANLKDVLTSKVVAGRITSIASKISGTLLGRGSANNLPPSLRGTLSGRFTQIGSAFKSGFAGATKAIGSFFSGFKFSDRRLKEEIQFIAKSPAGINIYSFKYKQLPGRYIGVMAQEVPWATHMTETGFYAVDYSKVDVKFRRLH